MRVIPSFVFAALCIAASIPIFSQSLLRSAQLESSLQTSLLSAAATQQLPQANGTPAGSPPLQGQPKPSEPPTYGTMLKKSVAFLSVS